MPHRKWQRLSHILSYGARQLVMLLGNAIIAWLVIKDNGEELWGGFVKVFVVISLTSNLINWGNRDYLLREFADKPSQISKSFWESFAARSILVFLGATVLSLILDSTLRLWAIGWMVAYYVYQSLDVFIVYHKRYFISALIEISGLASIAIGCHFWMLSIENLVAVFSLSFMLRALLLTLGLPKSIWSEMNADVFSHLAFFRKSKWFFFMGVSGLLQSRIDLYAISLVLSDEEVGRYQIMISLLILIQTMAGIMMTPFAINLMRQPFLKMVGISRKMMGIGVVISLFGVWACFFVLRIFYGINFPSYFHIWAILLVFPTYVYLTWIYYIYGLKGERWVMYWNFLGAIINLILTLVLIPRFGILGALISSATVQCSLAIVFPLTVKMIQKEISSNNVSN